MDHNLKYCYEYPRPAMTVDAIIIARKFREDMILLVQRKFNPFEGLWALPGGFVGMNETLKEACQRELYEETGLKDIAINQFFTFDEVNRDPRHRTISTVFYGTIGETAIVIGGDDAEKAEWFPILSLPDMAFDHSAIIEKFVHEKLQVIT